MMRQPDAWRIFWCRHRVCVTRIMSLRCWVYIQNTPSAHVRESKRAHGDGFLSTTPILHSAGARRTTTWGLCVCKIKTRAEKWMARTVWRCRGDLSFIYALENYQLFLHQVNSLIFPLFKYKVVESHKKYGFVGWTWLSRACCHQFN